MAAAISLGKLWARVHVLAITRHYTRLALRSAGPVCMATARDMR